MKGIMKGKLMKKLLSMKPTGYLKETRVLHVNAADGFIETLITKPSLEAQAQAETPEFVVPKEVEKEKVKDCSFVADQEPDVIDVNELMKDLEEEKEGEGEEMEMEVDEDKENVRPVVKARVGLFGVKDKVESKGSQFRQIPLSEIDISSFQRPDLNSDGLFYPNLLTAFEKAAKEHMGVSEEERRESIDGENLERIREAETQARTQQENLEKSREAERNLEDKEEEPPLKARRIEDDDDTGDPILGFPEKCPPGGSDSVILYTTTLRGIRKTFEDCNSIRFLLESFQVLFFERDVSMHMEFKEELWRILDGKVNPPRLFIKGRYIGGSEEVLGLHEQGWFRVLFEGIPIDRFIGSPCEGCAGVRFVLCFNCSGSHKVVAENGLSNICQDCNENGLITCPLCC
jgi:glutaredoxin domain-containing cysteine-rich protein 1